MAKRGRDSVQPKGEAVRSLRHKNGWAQERLASEAGYDKRTVQKVEGSRKVQLQTIKDFADALGVNVEQILEQPLAQQEQKPSPTDGVAYFFVKFEIAIPMDGFDKSIHAQAFLEHAQSFMKFIKNATPVKDDLRMDSASIGSVIIILSMSKRDILELNASYKNGQLREKGSFPTVIHYLRNKFRFGSLERGPSIEQFKTVSAMVKNIKRITVSENMDGPFILATTFFARKLGGSSEKRKRNTPE